MTHTPFLTDSTQIMAWLKKYCKIEGTIAIAADGQVTIHGDIVFRGAHPLFSRLEVCFAEVTGDFHCTGCPYLTTLRGAPAHVGGYFDCSDCPCLDNLAGAPRFVGDWFMCRNCEIRSLEGAPSHVNGNFRCEYCHYLVNLQGAPAYVGGSFQCTNCASLTSIKGLGVAKNGLRVSEISEPKPEIVRHFLLNRMSVNPAVDAPWISIVNDYHRSGDLFTAVDRFEKRYNIPFHDTIGACPMTSTLPSL